MHIPLSEIPVNCFVIYLKIMCFQLQIVFLYVYKCICVPLMNISVTFYVVILIKNTGRS